MKRDFETRSHHHRIGLRTSIQRNPLLSRSFDSSRLDPQTRLGCPRRRPLTPARNGKRCENSCGSASSSGTSASSMSNACPEKSFSPPCEQHQLCRATPQAGWPMAGKLVLSVEPSTIGLFTAQYRLRIPIRVAGQRFYKRSRTQRFTNRRWLENWIPLR